MTDNKQDFEGYWKENLKWVSILLTIWFLVSYGAGIIFVEPLSNFHLGGFPLGFWFANQGSMVIFVLLIYAYVLIMNNLDRKYDVEEK
jgi:putative solute:sodium symporter small subunit